MIKIPKHDEFFGGLEHKFYDFDFPFQLGIILPTHEVIFFRGFFQPPTGYNYSY